MTTIVTRAGKGSALTHAEVDANFNNLKATADLAAVDTVVTAALALKAPLASPALTGTPTAPTAAPGTNTTQVSTTAFVAAAIAAILNGVSASFDTLAEIATELGLKATIASPTFTGVPAAPTAGAGTNTTQLATTAFVKAAIDVVLGGVASAYDTLIELAAGLLVVPENAQTGTTYTLVLADAGKMVSMSNAGGITLTIPANASVAFPLNTVINLLQLGAGQVTVSPTGVTLQSASSKQKLTGQYSAATLWKKATDTWVLFGDIAT